MTRRSSLQIQRAVIQALAIRELKTRFGSYRLGYLWAILEPLVQILFFSFLYTLGHRDTIGGLDIPVFLATGIVPFLFFKKVMTQSLGAMAANRNLLIYRQVRVFDLFLVRFLIEMLVSCAVFSLLIAGALYTGYSVQLVNSLVLLASWCLLGFLSFGIGLMFGLFKAIYPEPGKLLPTLLTPLMFVSGTFFSINEMPEPIQRILQWNPLIHSFELMRSAFSPGYDTSLVGFHYLGICSLSALFLGILIFRANWRRMLRL